MATTPLRNSNTSKMTQRGVILEGKQPTKNISQPVKTMAPSSQNVRQEARQSARQDAMRNARREARRAPQPVQAMAPPVPAAPMAPAPMAPPVPAAPMGPSSMGDTGMGAAGMGAPMSSSTPPAQTTPATAMGSNLKRGGAVKKAAPTSKYRGGRSEADIQAMINEATPDRMRASQFAQDNPDATPFKKGGMVKSGASRGDGCAIRGRTKGKYC